jgi:arginine:ornithine antiporter / lysine permease
LARTNKNGAPVTALVTAAALIQLLLVVLIFASNALDFMPDLTVTPSLVPYRLAAGRAPKTTITRETHPNRKSLEAT